MLLAWILGSQTAWAFCGAYVGGEDAVLSNEASRMGVVRQDGRTTLTLLNDVQGDQTHFGLLIPLPEAISQDEVRIVEATLIDDVDAYTAPRLVRYTCEDFRAWDEGMPMGGSSGCGGTNYATQDASYAVEDGASGMGMPANVVIEERFSVGEYDMTVLQAVTEDGLSAWLSANGFVLNPATQDALAHYVAAESWFLAATVELDEADLDDEEGAWLSTLQLSYVDDSFGLPIRLGTASSEGVQDLILFTVTSVEDGQVHVSNYPERVLEDECMPAEAGEGEFGDFFDEHFGEAPTDGEGRATWTLEYGWPGYQKCDPCPDGSFGTADGVPEGMLTGLGWQGVAADAYLSRLHLRYEGASVDQDLSMYGSGITDTTQLRYIEYSEDLEDRFPLCVTGWVEDAPGDCDEELGLDESSEDSGLPEQDADPSADGDRRPVGCVFGGGMAPAFVVLVVLGLLRRKD